MRFSKGESGQQNCAIYLVRALIASHLPARWKNDSVQAVPLPSMKRHSFPQHVADEVLIKCLRRCALCWYLEDNLTWRKGQLAHIDRNRLNANADNAAYLCTRHHDEYDSRPSQTKRITPKELKNAQTTLHEILQSREWLRIANQSIAPEKRPKRRKLKDGVSLEVYDRRIPFYRATLQFVRDVVKDLSPEISLILKFGDDTQEALFLFDDSVASYLDEMFKKALRLHTINNLRERAIRDSEMNGYHELVREETDIALWFTRQYDVMRGYFRPFLHLAE